MSRAVPVDVQDHHAVGGAARNHWSLNTCPQVRAAIAKIRSLRTIQMYGRPEPCPIPPCRAVSEVDAEEPMRLGWRCIDHEQAN